MNDLTGAYEALKGFIMPLLKSPCRCLDPDRVIQGCIRPLLSYGPHEAPLKSLTGVEAPIKPSRVL